jgi:hypothetical protein
MKGGAGTSRLAEAPASRPDVWLIAHPTGLSCRCSDRPPFGQEHGNASESRDQVPRAQRLGGREHSGRRQRPPSHGQGGPTHGGLPALRDRTARSGPSRSGWPGVAGSGSFRAIAGVATARRPLGHLTKADTVLIAAIEGGAPDLVEARTLIDRFHAMIRTRSSALEGWIEDASASLVASFASGIRRGRAAVRAAMEHPWSNGPVEGQITKLKHVKRQMYGRAKLDLLEARLLPAA